MKENRSIREKNHPGMLTATVSLIILIVVIIACMKMGFGTQMSVFAGAVVSVVIALLQKSKWDEIQTLSMENLSNCGVPLIILALVGILVGTWLIGGTLPTLIYYGLKIISPLAILPLSFVLCMLTSVFTGTSFGSMATMGLAMFGIGVNMGIPGTVLVGAIVSGAYFGDKMSPMSDTTNVAPAMAGTDLYSHIGSMMYTTLPATLAALILYIVIGLKYADTAFDATTVNLMIDTLEGSFNLTPICLLPLVMVLALSVLKVPSVLAMGAASVVSVIIAMLTQQVPVRSVMSAALNGYVSSTGVSIVDTILTRGGIASMIGTISIIFFSSFMAGALKSCGILDVFVEMLLRVVTSTRSLIVTTLVFGWGIVMLTGNQMLGIIIPGKAMGDAYDKLDVHRKVLSRSLEDSATIGAPLIPWSSATAYITGVFGIGIGYIPFALLCWLVPVFSVLCACTGFGVWHSNESDVAKRGHEKTYTDNLNGGMA
ncbi:MAG: Na+/H+ antiporter NhaC [Clostridiales bacterium]|nr:Na+/H+ antiporter NhaC [Clostridiales bacterium]